MKYQKPIILTILLLVFATWFSYNIKNDFRLIFQKDLLAHDESSNSVVEANITRKFFPPMVRVNPLNDEQGNWMEGPFWQHIPPLFAYVPYLFFKLDGQVTIEVKRLSFAFLTLLTGLLFIFSIYKYKKSLLAAFAATIAAILWVNTPFTHELITGYAFGASDIVLAFTIVCAFAGVIWYLRGEGEERREYSFWKLGSIALLVALPIMAKSLLGAIPAATFFGLLVWDYKAINKKFFISVGAFFAFLLLYFLPLYFSSPATFKSEILVPFFHFQALEGWGRPWYYYLTNYLPLRYLFGWTWAYYLGLVVAITYNVRFFISKREGRRIRITLVVSLLWFVWNLLAVSLVTSKVPNFIYQSYLLSLFFIVYSLISATPDLIRGPLQLLKPNGDNRGSGSQLALGWALVLVLIFTLFFAGHSYWSGFQLFKTTRAAQYNYQTEHEKFYQLGEKLRRQGIDTQDLVIVYNPPNDCWERYYILFLIGAESKTLLEMYFNNVSNDVIRQKYRAIYYIDQNFEVKKIATQEIDSLINLHKLDIEVDIQRIKKDKSSCQWLVPDPILNAE